MFIYWLHNEDEIKRVSLQHNIKILTKNVPRPQDRDEIKKKEHRHNLIMSAEDKDKWELEQHPYTTTTNNCISLSEYFMHESYI